MPCFIVGVIVIDGLGVHPFYTTGEGTCDIAAVHRGNARRRYLYGE